MTDPAEPAEPAGPDRWAPLQQTAVRLLEEVEGLAAESGTQLDYLAKRTRSNRRMIRAVAVSLAVDLALSGALCWTALQTRSNERATAAVTRRLDVAQTTTRQRTLCPLYTLLLAGDTPAARAAAPDPAVFDHTVQVIRQGYDALKCATPPSAP